MTKQHYTIYNVILRPNNKLLKDNYSLKVAKLDNNMDDLHFITTGEFSIENSNF